MSQFHTLKNTFLFSDRFRGKSYLHSPTPKYLINFLGRYNVKQITVFSSEQDEFCPKILTLPEMELWLIELNEDWDTPKINLAKLIYMSFEVKYTARSESDSSIAMILYNCYHQSMWFELLPPYYNIFKYKEYYLVIHF